jgi:predicted metal-dependent hydrolase
MPSNFFRNLIGRPAAPDLPPPERPPFSLVVVRNVRARRYILRLQSDGVARVTIPRGGSIREAHQFAARHTAWLERARHRLAARPTAPQAWRLGTTVWFRGENVVIVPAAQSPPAIQVGTETILVADLNADLRPIVEAHLRGLAERELPPRVTALAQLHQLTVHRVTVRNQRSRWGSCSRRRTISLNWRLIQTPAFVQDYIILHELMHLRQMNHSARFWLEVKTVCPDYEQAERWLKQHANLLR